MAKWWQFWRDDKAPGGGKGKPKPSKGSAGSGRVENTPTRDNYKARTKGAAKRPDMDGRVK